jgi:predicted permease
MAKINVEKLNKLKHKEYISFIIIFIILILLLLVNLVLFLIEKKKNKSDIDNKIDTHNSSSKIILYLVLAYIGVIILGSYIYLIIRRRWFLPNGYLRK